MPDCDLARGRSIITAPIDGSATEQMKRRVCVYRVGCWREEGCMACASNRKEIASVPFTHLAAPRLCVLFDEHELAPRRDVHLHKAVLPSLGFVAGAGGVNVPVHARVRKTVRALAMRVRILLRASG